MMAEPTPPYTDEQMAGDGVTKKDLVTFLQATASGDFLQERKLRGQVKNIAKTKGKDDLIQDYKDMFATKAFRKDGETDEVAAAPVKAAAVDDVAGKTEKLSVKEEEGPPKFKKSVLKKGNKINYPRKGDTVSCFYTGKLADGKVFDTNVQTGRHAKKAQPLKFKVGVGKVIRGWDEALLTMSLGEKAELVIEPEWGYGRRGVEGKIPKNATLVFEVELTAIE